MLSIFFNVIKIAFLLGFLIFIHELGHFLTAKLFKVRVKEFAIGFGPTIWKKQGKETKYELKIIPLGGFVNLLGEEATSEEEGSFSKASRWKRALILVAGGSVNILFGILAYFIIVSINTDLRYGFTDTINFIYSVFTSLVELFTGNIGVEQFTGPVGISQIVAQTQNVVQYFYILAVISLSLGVTNLLPFPPLDGGKILLLLIESIIRKPIKDNVNNAIQMAGFFLIITLAIVITYNDILGVI